MAVYKRGEKWRCVLRSPKFATISRTFETRRQAENFQTLKLIELSEKKADVFAKVKFKDFILSEVENLRNKNAGKAPNMVYCYLQLAKAEFADLYIHDISIKDAVAYAEKRKEQKLASSTLINEFSALNKLYEKAYKLNYTHNKSPFNSKELKNFVDFGVINKRERRLETAEEYAILAELGHTEPMLWDFNLREHQLIAFIMLAIETGMRAGELATLTKNQIDFTKRQALLIYTKNKTNRYVPLSKKSMFLMDMLLNHNGEKLFSFSYQALYRNWLRVLKELKIKNLTIHDLRHEATSRLARKIPPLQLAKMLGHKNLSMTMRYYNPTSEELAQVIDDYDNLN